MTDEYEYTRDLDLLGDWLDAKGYTEEAGLITRSMDFMHAQARRIAELESQNEFIMSANNELSWALKERDEATAHYRTLQARIAELEAALKPFADVANYFDNEPRYTDEDSPCEAFNTFGDLRAARAAYLGEKE